MRKPSIVEQEFYWRGFKLCFKCKGYKPITTFGKHVEHVFGLANICKNCRNEHVVSHRRGLTVKELRNLFIVQKDLCAICKIHKSLSAKGLAVDHDHKTGIVRGLLCINCNNGLGRFKENIKFLENALQYLKGETK